ncbi:hypothetical protein CUZ91_2076 [Enterococcus xinjiangensis]|nr:hypothetical protein [Enterococcus lactis]MBL5001016.1 hypothetical protein [Enterococcus lactis]
MLVALSRDVERTISLKVIVKNESENSNFSFSKETHSLLK